MKEWRVKRLSGSLGAKIEGADLGAPTNSDIDRIKSLLLDHKVLFFPAQNISKTQHTSLGKRFGPIEGHPNLKNAYPDHPDLFELAASQGGVADEWHSDLTFQQRPSVLSILHMVKCPPVGGDTMWASMEHAYNDLSEPMKELCTGLTALNDALPHNRPDKMTIHPVVRVHPVTGKKSLYVNEHFTRRIVEMNWSESKAMLEHLTNWIKSPQFTVRYQWSEGTVGIWDNRCTQHYVLNDFDGERIIQRVTVVGDKVKAASAPRWSPSLSKGPLTATSRHDRQLALYLKDMGQITDSSPE